MSYTFITKYNSPNYTSKKDTPRNYGMTRKVEGITIHWWGDPKSKPQFINIVNYLCRKGGNTSAHYVATGTGRQVACIVSPDDTAWHAGTAWGNARTIGIECDPRGRKEDFDVVAELVADIRSAYGDVPLYWHSYFVSTACPGIYRTKIKDLDKLSYTKKSASQWGKGGNKKAPAKPAPKPVPKPPAKPSPTTKDPVTKQPLPDTGKPIVDKDDYEATKARVSALETLLQKVVDFLSGIFSGFKK